MSKKKTSYSNSIINILIIVLFMNLWNNIKNSYSFCKYYYFKLKMALLLL